MDRRITLTAMLADARADLDRLTREVAALETALACYEPDAETKPEPPPPADTPAPKPRHTDPERDAIAAEIRGLEKRATQTGTRNARESVWPTDTPARTPRGRPLDELRRYVEALKMETF